MMAHLRMEALGTRNRHRGFEHTRLTSSRPDCSGCRRTSISFVTDVRGISIKQMIPALETPRASRVSETHSHPLSTPLSLDHLSWSTLTVVIGLW